MRRTGRVLGGRGGRRLETIAAVLVVGAEPGLLFGEAVAQHEDLGHLDAAYYTTPIRMASLNNTSMLSH